MRPANGETPAPGAARWVATWGTSVQAVAEENGPPWPLTHTTLRQKVYVSVGGEKLRLGLSNEFGDGPVTIESLYVALAEHARDGSVDASTDTELRFGGSRSITIAPGHAVVSDAVNFSLPAQSVVAMTMQLGSVPQRITGHPGSRTTSYLVPGTASAIDMQTATRVEQWYFIQGIDVATPSPAAAIVILGDSLTDGRGSTTNGNDRWPDVLSRRLRSDAATAGVAVVNAGIGGNALSSGGLGPTALERFDRDVVARAGARWLVVLEGVNDIGNGATASDVTTAYREMVARAHAARLDVLALPLLPFGGSNYDSAKSRAARTLVNDFIRTSGTFDAVLDVEHALRSADDPSRLRAEYHDGDWLHLNPAGHRALAQAIELSRFR